MHTRCDRCGAVRLADGNSLRCRCAGRDEGSALFSLASLTAQAAVFEDRRPAMAASLVPAAAGAAAGDSSGLIDLRAIQTMLGERRPAGDLLGVRPVAPASPPPLRPGKSSLERKLSLVLAAIMLFTAGLAGVLLLRALARPGPSPIMPNVVIVPQAAKEEPATPEEPAEPELPAAEPAPVVELPAAAPAPEPTRRRSERKPVGEKPAMIEAPKPVPAPAKAQAEELTVECIINPNVPGCRSKRPEAPAPVVVETPDPKASLPATLDPADIGEGTRAAKAAAASQCAALAKGGEAIKIKLSIAGPEGTVMKTTPEADAGNPQLAACVARELTGASFKKVAKPQIGAVVTVKF